MARGTRFWPRLVWAHLFAYPVSFAATVALLPLVIAAKGDALLRETGDGGAFGRWLATELALPADEARVAAMVLGPSLVMALVLALWVHVWAVPWARAEPGEGLEDPPTRRFAIGLAAPAGGLLLAGVGGWIWLVTR